MSSLFWALSGICPFWEAVELEEKPPIGRGCYHTHLNHNFDHHDLCNGVDDEATKKTIKGRKLNMHNYGSFTPFMKRLIK